MSIENEIHPQDLSPNKEPLTITYNPDSVENMISRAVKLHEIIKQLEDAQKVTLAEMSRPFDI